MDPNACMTWWPQHPDKVGGTLCAHVHFPMQQFPSSQGSSRNSTELKTDLINNIQSMDKPTRMHNVVEFSDNICLLHLHLVCC